VQSLRARLCARGQAGGCRCSTWPRGAEGAPNVCARSPLAVPHGALPRGAWAQGPASLAPRRPRSRSSRAGRRAGRRTRRARKGVGLCRTLSSRGWLRQGGEEWRRKRSGTEGLRRGASVGAGGRRCTRAGTLERGRVRCFCCSDWRGARVPLGRACCCEDARQQSEGVRLGVRRLQCVEQRERLEACGAHGSTTKTCKGWMVSFACPVAASARVRS
jgi:hypothetical protein